MSDKTPAEREKELGDIAYAWIIAFLAGKASLSIQPKGPGDSLLGGFTVRLNQPEE